MRHTSRCALALALTAALLGAPGTPQHAAADVYDQQIAALRANITSLQAQINGLNARIAGQGGQISVLSSQVSTVDAQQQAALAAAVQTQQALAATQAHIAATQTHLNDVNTQIGITTAHLDEVTAQLGVDKQHLSDVLTNIYEMQSSGVPVEVVLNSPDFTSLAQSLISLRKVNSNLQTLTETVRTDQQNAAALRRQELHEQAQVQADMDALQALAATQQNQEATYQAESAALHGQAAVLNSQIGAAQGSIGAERHQIAADQAEIASDKARIVALQEAQAASHSGNSGGGGGYAGQGAIPPFAFGARWDPFPWGQCTWYVASLRNVTWSGDAKYWAGNARAQGYSEGMTPRPGAIVVWNGGNGYSWFGHVAYVRYVLGSHTFVVDEANYYGLGRVDQRTIYSLWDVEAFIY